MSRHGGTGLADCVEVFRASARDAVTRAAMIVCFWKRCIILRFTTSLGGHFRSGSATGTACGNGSGD